jgi:putative phosphoribosyl transferase
MLFADRNEAAGRLADALQHLAGRHPLVLAIPRGAVPMGAVLARRLAGELDIVLVRKLHAPRAPEFAVGSIDETGWQYTAPHALSVGATTDYLREAREYEQEELRRRRRRYTPGREPISVEGRTVIVVDDGLATGATMLAALHAVRQRGPEHLVCGVPVASPESLQAVAAEADEVVCLHAPRQFRSVGQFYASFPQLEDEEVVACLGRS